MVLHLRAPKGKVSVEVMLNRAKYFDRTGKVNDHTIYLSGNLGKNALEFAMCLSAKAIGGRVALSLPEKEKNAALPTDERLQKMIHGGTDEGLAKLLFDYGRYLLIECSRPGDLPATLQGIWNKDFMAPWDSKYTININTEMNYWPAEVCALPKAWDHGEVKGLRLVGNASIALAWENGKLTRCAVTADQAYEGEVVYGEMRQAVKLEKGETVMLDAVLQLLES